LGGDTHVHAADRLPAKAPAARLAVEGGAAPGELPVAVVAPAPDAQLT
jgi:hypothetical protein